MSRLVRTLMMTLALTLAVAANAVALGPLRAGQQAPDFTLPTLTGGSLSLQKLRGHAVYLNFFASWCGPCNEEAPAISALATRYRKHGLTTVGVDEQESRAKAEGFIKKFAIGYDVVMDGGDLAKGYGILALPVHVFIDRRGAVKLYRLGEMSPREIEAAIRSIL